MAYPVPRLESCPQLLLYIGYPILNRQTLYNLCLTNKCMNECFTPRLYEEVYFTEENASILTKADSVNNLMFSDALKYTKVFDLDIPVPTPSYDGYHQDGHGSGKVTLWNLYNAATASLLRKLTGLTTFSWKGLPLYLSTLSTLHAKCPDLKSLHVTYPRDMEVILLQAAHTSNYWRWKSDRDLALMGQITYQALPEFSNLTSLDIRNLHLQVNQITKSIAKVLVASPAIKSLSLSLAQASVLKCALTRNRICDEFLPDMIDAYFTEGGQQMRLHRLALGFGVRCPYNKDSARQLSDKKVDIQKLTHLKGLQELCIHNPFFAMNGSRIPSDGGFVGQNFPPHVCTSLNHLSFEILSEPLGTWCKQLAAATTGPKQVDLDIMKRNDEYDDGTRVWLEGYITAPSGTYIKGLENFWKPNDRSSAHMLNMLTLGKNAWATLDEFPLPTVKHLQALSIDTSFHGHYLVARLFNWIGRLKELQQLSIYASNPAANPGSGSHRPAICLTASESKELADDIIALNMTLRYVKVEKWTWRVHYEKEEYEEIAPRLERLDRFEAREIQAFVANGDPFDCTSNLFRS
ncbi:hypothetical protein BJ875DRAFT_494328 [Amylocarpus encephaloides]|uniref:Uncharacterized protein n=1 Tax=Amylocarpus encephaloides TaxID=45428 RepID=A0A9P7YMK6_9HELO|nr:hypothetical protein BJ875DRAFT_494328 [Amylocarpus encephaloides]